MPTKTELNQKLLNEVYDIYTQAEIDILKNIAKKQKKGNNVEGWAEWKLKDIQELREETRKALEGPNKKVKNIMSDNLLKIYKGAKASVSSDLGVPMTAISDIVPPKLQRLILETNQLIDGTSVQILRNVDDVYRGIIAETSTGVLSGMDTREQAIQKALNKFADKGITGFVDRIGRQWEMASYVDMAIRTTASNAALQGHIDRQIELGEDLMIVSSFGNTCPLCMPWEGVILSISGNSLKYTSLEKAKAAGLFHPNCKHTLLVYVEGITEPVKQEPEPEVYDAQQVQRYNERQIRKWKRRQAVALSPKEQMIASNKVKQWQSIQRDHIKEWDLRRNYKRESIRGRVAATKVEPVQPFEPPKPIKKLFNPKDYKEPDEGEVELHGEYLRGPRITPEEKEAIRKYTGQFYVTSNYYLRNGSLMKNNSSYSDGETKDYIKNISSGISKAPPLVQDTILYRKVSTDDIEKILGIEDESFKALKNRALKSDDKTAAAMIKSTLKGGTLSDKAFLSTTRIESRMAAYEETIFEFYLPEGYNKGVFVESISNFKSEKEYILDKNQSYTIQDTEVRFGQLVIRVTPSE